MTIPVSVLLLPLPFILLYLEKKNLKQALQYLGLTKEKPGRQVFDGLRLFVLFFFVFLLLGAILQLAGILDASKVAEVVLKQPLYMLLIAATLAPIAEELFFRGYLQKKIGIVFTSLIFAAMHYAYGSVAEIVAAFVMSMIAGGWVRKHKTLAPVILAHALYNTLSITLALTVGSRFI